ncbi:MAG: hypothetical protein ABIW31_07565 [Novosphingobium sp.]
MTLRSTLSIYLAVAIFPMAAVAKEPPPKPLKPEVQTGSNIRVAPEKIEGARRDELISNFARCIVALSLSRTDYYLRHSDPLAADPNLDPVQFLPLSDCLGSAAGINSLESQGRFSHVSLRSWLTEAAYIRVNPRYAPLTVEALPAPSRAYFATGPEMQQAVAMGNFADCVTSRDSAGADAVLRTKRGSVEERAAARALAPVLGACVTAGQILTFNAATIRIYAAEGLWQRYEAAKPAKFKGRN